MRPFLAAVLLAAAAATAVPASAAATPDGADCGFLTSNAPVEGQPTWWGVLYGGPVTAPGADSVTLTCSIHVGNELHTGPAAATETSAATPGAAVLEPRLTGYEAADWEMVFLCTSATVDGVEWYLSSGVWSTTPGSCAIPLEPSPFDPLPPVVRAVVEYALCLVLPGETLPICGPDQVFDEVNAVFVEHVDPAVCPLLVAHAGAYGAVEVEPDGDVHVAGELVWDCPPYEP